MARPTPAPPRATTAVLTASRTLAGGLVLAAVTALSVGCAAGAGATQLPPVEAGTPDAPREINLIAKDYLFLPDALTLIPGETVTLHLINGGLVIHEAVIGGDRVQAAWETAEAATAGAPPGPTPAVSVPPDVQGIRLVVPSGARVDHTWTVPADRPALVVGCHIPGHWEEGMRIPVRWVDPSP